MIIQWYWYLLTVLSFILEKFGSIIISYTFNLTQRYFIHSKGLRKDRPVIKFELGLVFCYEERVKE